MNWILCFLLAVDPEPVHLEVVSRSEEFPTSAQKLKDRFQEELTEEILQSGVPLDPHAATQLKVEIVWDKADFDRFQVTVSVDGRNDIQSKTFDCAPCSNLQLLDRVRTEVDTVLGELKQPKVPEPVAAQPEPPQPIQQNLTPTAAATPTSSPDRSGKHTGMVAAGSVVMVAGIASTIAGAVYLARDDSTELDDFGLSQQTTRSATVGHALVWPGVGAVTAGAVILGIGIHRKRIQKRDVVLSPAWSPHYSGLRIQGRF